MIHEIHLRNNATGEIRVHVDEHLYESEAAFEYQYGEGNFGCDCNRWRLFERVAAGSGFDGVNRCGESRYSIVKVVRDGIEISFEDGPRLP